MVESNESINLRFASSLIVLKKGIKNGNASWTWGGTD
jgi:hypothetical protein